MDTVGGLNGERMVLIKHISQNRTQDGMQELSDLVKLVMEFLASLKIISSFEIRVLIE